MEIHLGKKIQEILNEKKISIQQFAEKIGVSPSSAGMLLQKEVLHPKWIEVISAQIGYNFNQYIEDASLLDQPSVFRDLKNEIDYLKKQNEEIKKSMEYILKNVLCNKSIEFC